jgi:hypothetical protein
MSSIEIDQSCREWPSSVPSKASIGPRKDLHDLGNVWVEDGLQGLRKAPRWPLPPCGVGRLSEVERCHEAGVSGL